MLDTASPDLGQDYREPAPPPPAADPVAAAFALRRQQRDPIATAFASRRSQSPLSSPGASAPTGTAPGSQGFTVPGVYEGGQYVKPKPPAPDFGQMVDEYVAHNDRPETRDTGLLGEYGPIGKTAAVAVQTGARGLANAAEQFKRIGRGEGADVLLGTEPTVAEPVKLPGGITEASAGPASEANWGERLLGGLAGMGPSLAEPKAIAAMILTHAPTGATMGSLPVQGALGFVSRKVGEPVARAAEAILHGSVGMGGFSGVHAGMEGGQVLPAAAEGAVQGAVLGGVGGLAGEALRLRKGGANPANDVGTLRGGGVGAAEPQTANPAALKGVPETAVPNVAEKIQDPVNGGAEPPPAARMPPDLAADVPPKVGEPDRLPVVNDAVAPTAQSSPPSPESTAGTGAVYGQDINDALAPYINLDSSELYAMADKLKIRDDRLAREILGPDAPSGRLKDSHWQMVEDRATPEQYDRLFRDPVNDETIRELAGHISDTEASSPDELSDHLARALIKIGPTEPAAMTATEQMYALKIRKGGEWAAKKGWDVGKIAQEAVGKAASRFSDPMDAEFMLGRYLKKEQPQPLTTPSLGEVSRQEPKKLPQEPPHAIPLQESEPLGPHPGRQGEVGPEDGPGARRGGAAGPLPPQEGQEAPQAEPAVRGDVGGKGTMEEPGMAVRMKDGSIQSNPDATFHAELVDLNKIDPEKIAETGYIVGGKYISDADFFKGTKGEATAGKQVGTLRESSPVPLPEPRAMSLKALRAEIAASVDLEGVGKMGRKDLVTAVEQLRKGAAEPPVRSPDVHNPLLGTDPRTGRPITASQLRLVNREGGAPDAVPGKKAGTPSRRGMAATPAELAKGAVDTWRDIRRVFATATLSLEAEAGHRSMRQYGAELARGNAVRDETFRAVRAHFDRMPKAGTLKIIDDLEHGRTPSDPVAASWALVRRQVYNDLIRRVHAVDKNALRSLITDYFPHVWKDPKKAAGVLEQIMARRPMQGSKGFLKQRSIPTVADGIAAGLEPVSHNPVELDLIKMAEMHKFIEARRLLNSEKKAGRAKFVGATEKPPDGWVIPGDRMFTVYGPKPAAGTTPYVGLNLLGHYAVPADAAYVYDQALSPGLKNHAWYKGLRGLGNVLNQTTLGVSGFHATFETVNATTGQLAHAIQRAATGHPVEGLIEAAKTPVAVAMDLRKGGQLMQAWVKPGSQGPEVERVLKAMVSGGARGPQDAAYATQITKNMLRSFREAADPAGSIPGRAGAAAMGTLRAPFAAIEQAARPTFEYMVPRLKLAAGFQMMEAWMRDHPTASSEEVRAAAGGVWNSVENRHGQMSYDNLAMNKIAKDLMMVTVGRPGWQIGTVRELAGGTGALAKGGSRGLSDPRGAYVAALPIVVGMAGAVINRMMTGEWPKQTLDYFAPRTGGTDKDGEPSRVMLPSYIKDAMHIATNPAKWAQSKINPALTMMAELMNNRDYFGTTIADPSHSLMGKLGDLGQFVGKSFEPYSTANLRKMREQGASPGKAAMAFVGVNAPPRDLVSESPAARGHDFRVTQDQLAHDVARQPQEKRAEYIRARIGAEHKAGTPEYARAMLEFFPKPGGGLPPKYGWVFRNRQNAPQSPPQNPPK